jgi:hypothetical protein
MASVVLSSLDISAASKMLAGCYPFRLLTVET